MLRKLTAKFLKDESGATAIEYGLIAALVSVAAIGSLTLMGDSLVNIFDTVKNSLDTASTSASAAGGGTTGTTTGG